MEAIAGGLGRMDRCRIRGGFRGRCGEIGSKSQFPRLDPQFTSAPARTRRPSCGRNRRPTGSGDSRTYRRSGCCWCHPDRSFATSGSGAQVNRLGQIRLVDCMLTPARLGGGHRGRKGCQPSRGPSAAAPASTRAAGQAERIREAHPCRQRSRLISHTRHLSIGRQRLRSGVLSPILSPGGGYERRISARRR